MRLARHLSSTESFLDWQDAIGIDVAFELGLKGCAGWFRELSRVVSRVNDIGTEPTSKRALRRSHLVCHHNLLFRDPGCLVG
jgi:hypothetical protein